SSGGMAEAKGGDIRIRQLLNQKIHGRIAWRRDQDVPSFFDRLADCSYQRGSLARAGRAMNNRKVLCGIDLLTGQVLRKVKAREFTSMHLFEARTFLSQSNIPKIGKPGTFACD